MMTQTLMAYLGYVIIGLTSLAGLTDGKTVVQRQPTPLFVLSPDCGTHTGNQSWLTNFYRVQLRSQIDTNGEYENDIDCYQHVIVTRNFGVHITFTYLEMQDPVNGSCVDYIRLYEGDMDHPITDELCGVQTMPELKTIQQHIILHVHTDNSIAKRGFEIYYIRVEDYEVVEEKIANNMTITEEDQNTLDRYYLNTAKRQGPGIMLIFLSVIVLLELLVNTV